MVGKYDLLIRLCTFAREIGTLREWSHERSECYELLEQRIERVCDFVSDPESAAEWRRWGREEEILRCAGDLRDTTADALGDLEKHLSRRIDSMPAARGPHLEGFSGSLRSRLMDSLRSELTASHMDESSRIVFIGAGALPVTALLLAREIGAELLCLDIDREALRLASKVVERCGLASKVRFSAAPVGASPFTARATHYIIASMVKNKRDVLGAIRRHMHDEAKVLLRGGEGIKSLINYPIEADLSSAWRVTPLVEARALYDAVLLEPLPRAR